MIRQWIPDCWSGDRKCTGPKSAAANSRNWQLMTSGRSQTLATRNFGEWHTVVGEVPRSSVAKTTMGCHSKLVLHSLRNNKPVQVIMHQPRSWKSALIHLPRRSAPLGFPKEHCYFIHSARVAGRRAHRVSWRLMSSVCWRHAAALLNSTDAEPALESLANCSAAVRLWLLRNDLQLNAGGRHSWHCTSAPVGC